MSDPYLAIFFRAAPQRAARVSGPAFFTRDAGPTRVADAPSWPPDSSALRHREYASSEQPAGTKAANLREFRGFSQVSQDIAHNLTQDGWIVTGFSGVS